MMGITERQAAIVRFLQDNGPVGATYQEIAAGIGSRSKGGTREMVNSLVERGWIRRLPNRHRALAVVRRHPPALFAPFAPSHFGSDPSAGRPTAYTGPYPIRTHGTCADWFEELPSC